MTSFLALPFIVVPENTLEPNELKEFASHLLKEKDSGEYNKICKIIDNTLVTKRHTVLPPKQLFDTQRTASDCNKTYQEEGYKLLVQAAQGSLKEASVEPKEINAVICVSCTGISIPSLSSRLIIDLGFNVNCVNLPVSQWGCSAGVACIKWADIYLKSHPDHVVLALGVEICSSMYHGESDISSMICNSLFGDAAGGAVVFGSKHPKAKNLKCGLTFSASEEFLIPDTQEWMKYEVSPLGLHFRLDEKVKSSMKHVVPSLKKFFSFCKADINDPNFKIVAHTGGPKILQELLSELYPEKNSELTPLMELPDINRTKSSLDVLRSYGNIAGCTIFTSLRQMLLNLPKSVPKQFPCGLISCGPGMAVQMGFGHLFVNPEKSTKSLENISPKNISPLATIIPSKISKIPGIYDCAIIGTGPIGGLLTLLLTKFGLNVLNLDQYKEPYKFSRADHIDAATLRILDYFEISRKMVVSKKVVPAKNKQVILNLGEKESPVAVLNLQRARTQFGDGGFSPTNFFSQVDLEKYIRNEISKTENTTSLYGWKLNSVEKNESGYYSVIVEHNKILHQINALRVIGCDGAQSLVRKLCFGSAGFTWDEKFLFQIDFDITKTSLKELKVPDLITQTVIDSKNGKRHLAIIPTGVNNRLRLMF